MCVNKELLFGWQMSTGLSGDIEAWPREVYTTGILADEHWTFWRLGGIVSRGIYIWEFLVLLTLYLGRDASDHITTTSLVFRSRSHAVSGEGFFSVITQTWHIHLQVCFCFFQSIILLGGPGFCETYRSCLPRFESSLLVT